MNATAAAKRHYQRINPTPIINANNANPPPRKSLKLPAIELPTFDGTYENWMSFQDLFKATVHSDTSLSGAEKMQYLVLSLRGEAASLVKSLQITDNNYKTAWKMITERYDHPFEIVMSLLSRLFNQTFMQTETASGLQQLLDTTSECRRALDVLGRDVQNWDDILVHLIMQRLDRETRRRWITSLVNKDIPSYANMVKFLEQYARGLACEDTGISLSHQSSDKTSCSQPQAVQQQQQ